MCVCVFVCFESLPWSGQLGPRRTGVSPARLQLLPRGQRAARSPGPGVRMCRLPAFPDEAPRPSPAPSRAWDRGEAADCSFRTWWGRGAAGFRNLTSGSEGPRVYLRMQQRPREQAGMREMPAPHGPHHTLLQLGPLPETFGSPCAHVTVSALRGQNP